MECMLDEEAAKKKKAYKKLIADEEKSTTRIDEELKQEKRAQLNKMKLLLLGTGDSGKSTIMRQLKVIYLDGYSIEELEHYRDVLRDNCLESMQSLCRALDKFKLKVHKEHRKFVTSILESERLTKGVGKAISKLWEDDATMREALMRSNEIVMPGGAASAIYFFENAKRFAEDDFIPREADVIRCKIKTIGIVEVKFSIAATDFTVVDVGGQKSERRKWIHCFGDVTAVIFVTSLTDYDMVLEEDGVTNRLEDSLKLFENLTGLKYFKDLSFILLLNKSDLFREKIKYHPFGRAFPDFETFVPAQRFHFALDLSDEFEKSMEYIKEKFVNKFKARSLYPFVTTSIDKDMTTKIFAAVRDTVISGALTGAGL